MNRATDIESALCTKSSKVGGFVQLYVKVLSATKLNRTSSWRIFELRQIRQCLKFYLVHSLTFYLIVIELYQKMKKSMNSPCFTIHFKKRLQLDPIQVLYTRQSVGTLLILWKCSKNLSWFFCVISSWIE